MRLNIKYLMACITLALFSFSSQMISQIKTSEIALLQGKWELENFTYFYGNDTTRINFEQLGHEIFTEVVFKNDSVFTKSEKQSLSGNYKIDGSYEQINFSFKAVPFDRGWNIIDNKLHVQQKIENAQDKSKTIYISLYYKRK